MWKGVVEQKVLHDEWYDHSGDGRVVMLAQWVCPYEGLFEYGALGLFLVVELLEGLLPN